MSLIYALVAKSNPSEIRYIGKTASVTPGKRLSRHLNDARNLNNLSYKCNWIRKVINEGDSVVAIVIESGLTEEKAFHREIFLISHYRSLDDSLTNLTDGGEGSLGNKNAFGSKRTPEQREKMSIAAKKRITLEERVKRSEMNKGNTHALGAKHTPAANLKKSIALKGIPKSPETIFKREATKKLNREAKAMALNNQGAPYEPSNT